MAISQNFPNTRPSLNLNFARSKKLDPRITFTRSSTATYVDEDGLIKSAATNTPRFEHDPTTGDCLGLLIEESRSNILLQSTTPDNLVSPWGKGPNTARIGVTTAPDGTNTAVYFSGDGSQANIFVSQGVNLNANTTYTCSVWAKLISGSVPTAGNIISASFHNGTALTRSNVAFNSNLTTEWKRFSTTFTNVTAQTGVSMFFLADQNNTVQIAIWGAQLEAGAFATSHIPTVASTVTRSADIASITGTNFSSWYNPSEGNVTCSGRFLYINPPTYGQALWAIGDSSTFNESMYLVNDTGTNSIGFNIIDGGVNQFAVGSSSVTSGSFNKISISYKANDSAGSFNSSTPTTDTSCTLPTVNVLKIGNTSWGTFNPLNGTISQLTYYPVRLTNSQLQTLTK
jgi:hypothetical protein